jgi:hypothetical protein
MHAQFDEMRRQATKMEGRKARGRPGVSPSRLAALARDWMHRELQRVATRDDEFPPGYDDERDERILELEDELNALRRNNKSAERWIWTVANDLFCQAGAEVVPVAEGPISAGQVNADIDYSSPIYDQLHSAIRSALVEIASAELAGLRGRALAGC